MSVYRELAEIVNLIKPKRFLEIGVDRGANLKAIDCLYKVGIDPNPKVDSNFPYKVYKDTSDNVFKRFNEEPFDLIFIDGLHEFKQVVRDIKNSLLYLNLSGMVVCHDVYPFDFLDKYPHLIDKEYPGEHYAWTGDVWKAVFYVRYLMPELEYCIIPNFPGYLYLWRAKKPRMDETKKITVDEIKSLPIEYGIEHKSLMKIVPLERLCRNLQ